MLTCLKYTSWKIERLRLIIHDDAKSFEIVDWVN